MLKSHKCWSAPFAILAFAPVGAAAAQQKQFNVPTQPAATGIREFARQADIQILVPARAARGETTGAVSGAMSVKEGLRRLLSGTALHVRANDGQTVVLRKAELERTPTSGGHPVASTRYAAQLQTEPVVATHVDAIIAEPPTVARTQTSEPPEIIVTAQRREERLMSVPVAVTAVSGATMLAKGLKTANELSYSVPGLVGLPNTTGGTNLNISLRGIAPSNVQATQDPATGIYVDGLYYPRAQGANVPFVDIERVEVLKGPQGTLFGRNTIGGAISITTSKPVNRLEGLVRAEIGNKRTYNLTAILNTPLTDELAFRIVYDHQQHGGYGHNAFHDEPTGTLRQDYVRGTLSWRPKEGVSVIQTIDYLTATQRPSTSILFAIFSPPDSPPPAVLAALAPYLQPSGSRTSFSGLNRKYRSWSFDYTGTVSVELPFATLKSITGYRKIDNDAPFDTDATPSAQQDLHGFELKGDQISEEIQLIGESSDRRLKWIAGLFYAREHIPLSGPTRTEVSGGGIFSDTALRRIRTRSQSVFAQMTYEFIPGLRATAGIRYVEDKRDGRYHSLRTTSAGARSCSPDNTIYLTVANDCEYQIETLKSSYTPWTIGLDYTPNDDLLLYGKVARGFRSGGFQSAFFSTNPSDPAAPPFDSFGTERATTYEVGAKASVVKALDIRAAAYLTKYSDIQTSTPFVRADNTVTTFFSNTGSANLKGVEVEATARLGSLQLDGGFSIFDGKFTAGPYENTPYYSNIVPPKYTATAMATHTMDLRNGLEIRTTIDYSYRSRFYHNAIFNVARGVFFSPQQRDSIREPAYGLLNARVALIGKNKNWRVELWGKNLTKEYYFIRRQLQYATGYNTGIPGDPRTYGITVQYSF